MKIKVSERAVLARLNRALAKDGQQVKKCRPNTRGYFELGDYYVVDANAKAVVTQHLDLEARARELGALQPYEEVGEFESFADAQAALGESLLAVAKGEPKAIEDAADVRKDAAAFTKGVNKQLRVQRAALAVAKRL